MSQALPVLVFTLAACARQPQDQHVGDGPASVSIGTRTQGGGLHQHDWTAHVGLVVQTGLSVDGTDADLLDAELRRLVNRIRYCLSLDVLAGELSQGWMTLSWTILQDGTIQALDFEELTWPSGAFEACVRARFGSNWEPVLTTTRLRVQYVLDFAEGGGA